jgi:hypothetical protein
VITLPYEYRSCKTLLAELDPEHYITDKKKVVAKLTADNLWVKPVVEIEPTGGLILTDAEYEELTADWKRFQEWQNQNVEKHLAGKHDQSSHANRLSAQSPDFSDSEKQAIASYSGLETLQVNHKLRGLPTKGILPSVFDLRETEIESIVTNLDSAIDKSTLKSTLKLQREMPVKSIPSSLFGNSVGKTISDKGFLSLRNTQDKIPARNGFVKMIVTAPAGSKALDLSFINPNAMGEIIFPRGTKIKITSVRGQMSDTIVRGEIVE